MKRTYAKPSMTVERFLANVAVATCEPENVYTQVPVDCLASGSHTIFYDRCEPNYNDCAIVITPTASYLVWAGANLTPLPAGEYYYNGTIGSGPSGVDTLVGVVLNSSTSSRAGGGGNGGNGGSGGNDANNYHAGVINPKITSVVNTST